MDNKDTLVGAETLKSSLGSVVVLDCRFALGDSGAGESAYARGHIPGAHYLHLERDLSGPVGKHGGRHPLPDPQMFSQRLASLGIGRNTRVVIYDDNGFGFAARPWWMMRALGYSGVRILDGGVNAWRDAGGVLDTSVPVPRAIEPPDVADYLGAVNVEGVRSAMSDGATLVDSRDAARYQGLEEPVDPVAGHIPGAINLPWQGATDDRGYALNPDAQAARLGALPPDKKLVVYCGSGVTACVNLLALHLTGREDALLYPGSWSDWCSYLKGMH